MIFARSVRRFIQPRQVTLFGEPIKRVDTSRYLGVNPSQTTHLVVSNRTAQQESCSKDGLAGYLLNRSELSVRNGALLYKQPIRSMMDYSCPAWRSAARTHIRRLQVLQTKCLRLVTLPLGTSVAGRFTRISVFHYSPTTSEP
jgi:hypothetical protein